MNIRYALGSGMYLSDRYRIDGVIGQGGFGITYVAYDEAKSKKCAIKEYFPRDSAVRLADGKTVKTISDEKRTIYNHGLTRFIEEADVLWKLQGVESVVSVYDRFKENGTGYYVMEYVDGVTLKKLIKENGKLKFKYVNKILFDVGTALIQVHALNIFHRDIKPDNIMVNSAGVVKLIDFGNAKSIKRQSDNEQLSVMLTPGFAPLEQYSTKTEQGTFTDVYALAATVYFLLTGTMLAGPNDRLLSGEDITLDDVPEYVSDALYRALRVNYKERTQTIYKFLSDMRLINETVYSDDKIHNKDNIQNNAVNDDSGIHAVTDNLIPVTHGKIPHPYIVIISGDNEGMTIDMPLDRGVIVGRTKNYAQIIFKQDEFISKKHCEVYYDSLEDLIYITDLSTNGTWVNGYKLNRNQIYSVNKGSVVTLANQKCSFKVGVTYL